MPLAIRIDNPRMPWASAAVRIRLDQEVRAWLPWIGELTYLDAEPVAADLVPFSNTSPTTDRRFQTWSAIRRGMRTGIRRSLTALASAAATPARSPVGGRPAPFRAPPQVRNFMTIACMPAIRN